MKLTKSKLKEWIKEDLLELYSEAEDDDKKDSEKSDGAPEKSDGAPEGGLGPTKLKIDIPDNPFDGVHQPDTAQVAQLKELVKKKLKELQFKSPEAYEKYKEKHKIRKSTQVNVGGKDTTAGELDKQIAKKNDLPFDPDPSSDEPEMDAGGPAHANVPKGAKTSKDARGMKKAQDLAKSAIPKSPDVDSAAKDLGWPDAKEVVMFGMSDDIADLFDHDGVWDNLPKDLHHPINTYLDRLRDNEQGMRDDDDDTLQSARDNLLGILQNPEGWGKEKETGDHLDQMGGDDEESMDDLMKQMGGDDEGLSPQDIDKYNSLAARGKPVTVDTDVHGTLSWEEGDPQSGVMIGLDPDGDEVEVGFDDIVRVNESVGKRRCTVKEVKKWFKSLEENRYKKTYNSDARRVSWMVNNMKEDVANMPKSMRKKWSKAAYGRERFLAKEFVKHLMTKQVNEQKVRKFIRGKLLEVSLRKEIRKILNERG